MNPQQWPATSITSRYSVIYADKNSFSKLFLCSLLTVFFSPTVPQPAAASPLKLLPLPDARTGQLPTIRDNQCLPAQGKHFQSLVKYCTHPPGLENLGLSRMILFLDEHQKKAEMGEAPSLGTTLQGDKWCCEAPWSTVQLDWHLEFLQDFVCPREKSWTKQEQCSKTILSSEVLGKLLKVSPMTAGERKFIPLLICLHCWDVNLIHWTKKTAYQIIKNGLCFF